MNKRIERYINLASKIAEKSTSKYRLGCIIVKKGKIVSVGYNSTSKTHPKSRTWGNYLHSEIRALISLSKEDSNNATVYVARIRKDSSYAISKPCPVCYEALKVAGIKFIVYTDNNGIKTEEIV